MTFHLSISTDVPEQPSPFANVIEQGTPLTNNLSESTKQVGSRHLQKINVLHSENTAKQQSPCSIECVVAVMHTNQHYAVMEITIDTKTIKFFDRLYRPFLDWKDHVISAMRKCMLVDLHVVPSSAQFNADAAVVELVSCSRTPKPSVNGYDTIIAMQKWQLEKGYFLHQSDRNNCRPIACMKIMELFHASDGGGG